MILCLYHSPTEHAGLITEVLLKGKYIYGEVEMFRQKSLPEDLNQIDALVLMGGPMNVNETAKYPFLETEVDLIRNLVRHKKPVLGICLGAQLIAKALGSDVFKNSKREVGWGNVTITEQGRRDVLFKEFSRFLTVLHWHGDTFNLPNEAVHLAKTPICENQAFRFGNNVYGLQFHLEVNPQMVNEWTSAPADLKYVQEAGVDPLKLKTDTPHHYESLKPYAEKFFTSFFELFCSSALR